MLFPCINMGEIGNNFFRVIILRKRKEQKIDLPSIRERIKDCPDIIQKNVYIDNLHEAYFFYIKENIDRDLIQRDFISHIGSPQIQLRTKDGELHLILLTIAC